MYLHKIIYRVAVFGVLMSLASTAYSDEHESRDNDLELSLRTNVLLGDSLPANDILGIGVIGRYHLTNGWFAGAAIDAYKYDYENAALFAGIVQDPNASEFDALASNTVVSGFIGRLYGKTDRGFDWFWSAGLGIGFPDIDDFSGLTLAGVEFDLAFDAQTEIHVMGSFGTTHHFTPTWAATFAARLEHHFMDVTSTDAVSGATSTLNSQSPFGAYISLDYRF